MRPASFVKSDCVACPRIRMVPYTRMATHRIDELRRRHARAEAGGGEERRARQHKDGKLSARERIDLLLDEGSFEETDKLVRHRARDFGMDEQVVDGDGFITGYGLIHGRPAYVF